MDIEKDEQVQIQEQEQENEQVQIMEETILQQQELPTDTSTVWNWTWKENRKKANWTARTLSLTGLTAAVYVVLTISLPMLIFGVVQVRFSEIMNLLAFANPVFAPGLILGCFISNLFSPNGALMDCTFGTIATALALVFVTRSKNLLVASLWPTVFCAIVGLELWLLAGSPYSLVQYAAIAGSVMVGEVLAVTVVGVPLFMYLLQNKKFASWIKSW